MNTERKRTCPIQKIVTILSDAWTVLIVRDVLTSPKRFCELEKSLTGISTRTLTIKLQKLIDEGIIEHTDLYYRTTSKGTILKSIIDEMSKVGKKL
jgi:DNA-binding HxlR family transcriptional regulator